MHIWIKNKSLDSITIKNAKILERFKEAVTFEQCLVLHI